MSVSIGPGMISITRIPNCATSAASDSPSAVTAAFDARYVPRNGTGASVDDDVTLQMTPPPAARMIGTARFVTSTSPNTLVANSRCHDSSGMCSSGRLSLSTPALLTSTRRPSGSAIVDGSVTSSVHLDPDPRQGGEVGAVGRIAHRRDRVEAARRQLDRDRAPDPPARAGHHSSALGFHER